MNPASTSTIGEVVHLKHLSSRENGNQMTAAVVPFDTVPANAMLPLLLALPIKTTSTATNLSPKQKTLAHGLLCLSGITYVEVAAKISILFAELNFASMRAKNRVKAAVTPILAFVVRKLFNAKIVSTGNNVERIVAIMVLALSIFRLSYEVLPVSASATLPDLKRFPTRRW